MTTSTLTRREALCSLAGGGVKRGFVLGSTDEFGHFAVQDKAHTHDLHATILHLLGLDHERLTYHERCRENPEKLRLMRWLD